MQGDAVLRQVVTFGRILREAGLEVGPGRLADALSGLDETGLARRDDVYWTLRTTLVSRADDLETFDRAFAAWFLGAPVRLEERRRSDLPQKALRAVPAGTQADGEQPPDAGDDETGGFSFEETLRHKDFAEMTPEELARARKLIAKIATERPKRRSRRLRPAPRGERLDLRRMVRASLATGGDPLERPYRARVERHRKLVLICDVSGSMEKYSRALLLFLHAAHGSGTRRRDVRLRHAPHAPDAGAGVARPRGGARRRPRRGSSTGRAGRGSAPRSSTSTTSGAGARSPAARWS